MIRPDNKIFRVCFAFLFSVCLILLWGTSVKASEIYFGTLGQTIGVGQRFEVRLFLDTQDKTINAMEGKIIFSSDTLELKEIRDGNSIINFWVEGPSAAGNEINFSGIIPGGYDGQNGLIFSLIFEAKKEGAANIFLENASALLNNGQGTADATTVKNLELKIEKTGTASVPEISDSEPPENFNPLIGRNPDIFGGKWFLTFATQDEGSGIDYYQVQERWFWQPDNNAWKKAESPYLLKDQGRRSYIYVRAVDKAGNARLAALSPTNLPLYQLFIIFGIIVVVLVLLRRKLWRKKYHEVPRI